MMDSLFGEEGISEMRKRKKKKGGRQVFKEYNQAQLKLLPPSLDELIPPKHIVRVINRIVENMNIKVLEATYKGGGASAYDPRMMLKVVIYSFVSKIYSVRQIAKALRENICFMWLAANNKPDFRTISYFILNRLTGEVLTEIFTEVIIYLIKRKYIDMKEYFVDGSIIKANANKHSYVWRKNIERYRERIELKIKDRMEEMIKLIEEENSIYGDRDLEELGEWSKDLTSEEEQESIERLNKLIGKIVKGIDSQKEVNKRLDRDRAKRRRQIKSLNREINKFVEKKKIYDEYLRVLKDRNSCSKTDLDATFTSLKTKGVEPAYMVMIGTENQFIINGTVCRRLSEAKGFKEHMEELLKRGLKPERVVGDSGFGSEQNYEFLEKEGIEGYLKYNTFNKEEKGNKRPIKGFVRDNFKYDKALDVFICPEGKELRYIRDEESKVEDGHKKKYRVYRCNSCISCSFRWECIKSNNNYKEIRLNTKFERYKEEAFNKLTSEEGKRLRKRRNYEVESVFGIIKDAMGFRKFLRRGIEKVKKEFNLVCIAYNLKRLANFETAS
ncbi:MAG: IS1182 family transposase [Ignavibacteria bacterium]|nr:IS1182 family transposase [Ignavibacteria bacterium]